ncbi:MAG: DegT/DnrJ/EryC1/StrS family aminotransferase [Deltaproteobacteria bacterium]|nr:DegT/DnrJ/EryC1/StrS family aminotransferase [Deltaproteobacteria bacterium]
MPLRPIPFLDLPALHRDLMSELLPALEAAIGQASFVGGAAVESFERTFAAHAEAAHCVGVANGTDALYLALRALAVGEGDEVVTVANTFIGTVEAITLNGARPVFVETDPETYLIDPEAVERAIGPRTRAILAVHLYGNPAPLTALRRIADHAKVPLIEDAAQAHGARWGGRRVGGIGDAGCFSFYPSKNLGAFGDAGAVTTQHQDLAARIRRLSNHGRGPTGLHEEEGVNSRLDALQAIVLEKKLDWLDAENEARRERVEAYRQALHEVPAVTLPRVRPEAEPVWHLLPLQVPERDALHHHLASEGIETRLHHAHPLHLQPAYRHLGLPPGHLPVTEAACARLISLPLHPQLDPEAIARICEAIARFAHTRGW